MKMAKQRYEYGRFTISRRSESAAAGAIVRNAGRYGLFFSQAPEACPKRQKPNRYAQQHHSDAQGDERRFRTGGDF
jgi:hypothetical protein